MTAGPGLELPEPNTITRPYRGLSVQEVDIPLTPAAIGDLLRGRDIYRRTAYLALRSGGPDGPGGRPAAGSGPAVLARGRAAGAVRTHGNGLDRFARDRRRQRHLAGHGGARPPPRRGAGLRGAGPFRACQLHLATGAGARPGHRSRAPAPAQAAGHGRAGGRLRRGPAAAGAGARRGGRARAGGRPPGPALPAALPGQRPAGRAAGQLPGHAPALSPGLAAHRLPAFGAVPRALLRRPAAAGRPMPQEPGGRARSGPHQVLPAGTRPGGARHDRGGALGRESRRGPRRAPPALRPARRPGPHSAGRGVP